MGWVAGGELVSVRPSGRKANFGTLHTGPKREGFRHFMDNPEQAARYTWGDDVTVSPDAPHEWRPGECGAVCALSWVTEVGTSGRFHGCKPPFHAYTVEFSDGTDALIPEDYLTR